MEEAKKKKQIAKISIFITSIFIIFMGVTYGFISMTITGNKKQVITAGTLDLILEEDSNNISLTDALPMYDEVGKIQDPFTFRLVNNGDVPANYMLQLEKIKQVNELSDYDVRIHLSENGDMTHYPNTLGYLSKSYQYGQEMKDEMLEICKDMYPSVTTEEECSKASNNDNFDEFIKDELMYGDYVIQAPYVENLKLYTGTISGKETKNFELRLWISDSVSDNSEISGKNLSYKLKVEITQKETMLAGMLKPYKTYKDDDEVGEFWKYNEEITSVHFENSINVPTDALESWDVSVNQDGSVMAYIEDDGLGTSTYKLHIQANDKIYANVDSRHLFSGFLKLTTIEGMEYFDTSNVTTMNGMFDNCYKLTNLDLSNFDTSNVIDMGSMFSNCSSLTSLDVSTFDTSNVTYMHHMFSNCSELTNLDLSNFDTSKVTDMQSMFAGNRYGSIYMKLESIDLSSFDTSNVINMGSMFSNCSSLTNLDVGTFDTSKVEVMAEMFYGCNSLTVLDLSGFNTLNVGNVRAMFENCSSLINLDFRKADFSSVGSSIWSYKDMFQAVPTSIQIIVKDQTQKDWLTSKFSSLTNIVIQA